MTRRLVRFDWAIKKLLRHKANFKILEGFLTELLKFDVTIERILESESNKEDAADKYNRVDVLASTSDGELVIIEVQNESQVDYFQRMVYGVSKLISEYISEGQPYSEIRKVYSINIVYFELGQGTDYVYEYNGNFVGIHNGDILRPTLAQKNAFEVTAIQDIFPKYYVLKVNNFNDVAKDTLDEWIYFLKNSEVPEDFKAKGLQEARETLREASMSDEERRAYHRFRENRRIERSVTETAILEGRLEGRLEGIQEGLQQGIETGRQQGIDERDRAVIMNMLDKGLTKPQIADFTGLPLERIEKLLEA